MDRLCQKQLMDRPNCFQSGLYQKNKTRSTTTKRKSKPTLKPVTKSKERNILLKTCDCVKLNKNLFTIFKIFGISNQIFVIMKSNFNRAIKLISIRYSMTIRLEFIVKCTKLTKGQVVLLLTATDATKPVKQQMFYILAGELDSQRVTFSFHLH